MTKNLPDKERKACERGSCMDAEKRAALAENCGPCERMQLLNSSATLAGTTWTEEVGHDC